MKTINIIYNDLHPPLHLLICIEHGYCIAPNALKRHLNVSHGVKGDRLHAALAEAGALAISDPRQVQPPTDAPAIPHLPINLGFRCGITACQSRKSFI